MNAVLEGFLWWVFLPFCSLFYVSAVVRVISQAYFDQKFKFIQRAAALGALGKGED